MELEGQLRLRPGRGRGPIPVVHVVVRGHEANGGRVLVARTDGQSPFRFEPLLRCQSEAAAAVLRLQPFFHGVVFTAVDRGEGVGLGGVGGRREGTEVGAAGRKEEGQHSGTVCGQAAAAAAGFQLFLSVYARENGLHAIQHKLSAPFGHQCNQEGKGAARADAGDHSGASQHHDHSGDFAYGRTGIRGGWRRRRRPAALRPLPPSGVQARSIQEDVSRSQLPSRGPSWGAHGKVYR